MQSASQGEACHIERDEKVSMYAYCLFCQTQRARTIAQILEHIGIERAFVPQVVNAHRVKGHNEEKVYDLFPGYVFFYSKDLITDYDHICRLSGVIRILNHHDGGCALSDQDYSFAMGLYEKNGTIDKMRIVKAGDQVRVEEALFRNIEATVLKVDYRKKRAKIAYHFDKHDWTTWVACDVLYTENKDSNSESTHDAEI